MVEHTNFEKAFGCEHRYCQDCITNHIKQNLKNFIDIVCPEGNCKKPLDQQSSCFKNFSPEDMRKYKKIQKLNFVNSDPNLRLCPM